MSQEREAVVSPEVHAPFESLFPHAVKAGGMVFVSGTLPWDKTGQMVEGGIKEHTHQTIKNLSNSLEAAGSSLDKAVKVNIFVTDMDDFPAVNEVYGQWFKKPNLPCRTCVGVKSLPFNADVKIECTALV